MDNYIKQTIDRYRSDRGRYEEIQKQRSKLDDEGQKLYSRMGAYLRIIKDSLGEEAVKSIQQEFEESESPDSESKKTVPTGDYSITNADDVSITDMVLEAIQKGSNEGITAAQVLTELKNRGVGIEKRNTVYGTLSRLYSSDRINRVGKRYFATKP